MFYIVSITFYLQKAKLCKFWQILKNDTFNKTGQTVQAIMETLTFFYTS